MLKIDAHQHFWHYSKAEYGWIPDDMASLRRDFLPPELKEEMKAAGIGVTIAVQARQSLAETDCLLALAEENSFIAGVVGWLPLSSPDIAELLEKYARQPKLKAVRHVIQEEANDRFILGREFGRGVALLKEYSLTYDILIFERHLPYAAEFVDSCDPGQIFVLDHIGKPEIGKGKMEPWTKNLRELARRQNVFCKLSGMVTEAGPAWTEERLRPYAETVLEAFGTGRVIFGSDWPVCTARIRYGEWVRLVSKWIARLSPDEQNNIMGGNARKAYRL